MDIKALEAIFGLTRTDANGKRLARKTFVAAAVKGIDSQARTIRAYASTNAWDRYGERFEADAFKDGLGNYKKNPVILFGHDYGSAPIAKAIKYEFDDKGLILTMKFADTEKAREVFSLYEDGFMSAFSVGFRPLEYRFEEREPGVSGAVFVKAELLENSAVPVPANPEAVVIKGLSGKTMTISGELLRAALEDGWKSRVLKGAEEAPADPVEDPAPAAVEPGAVVPPADPVVPPAEPVTPPVEEPKSLKAVLGYLLTLGKAAKDKGDKLEDAEVRSLAIQANNILRELVLGVGAEALDGAEGAMSDDEAISLVREYEMLSEKVVKGNANEKDRAGLVTLGEQIKTLISKTAKI